MHCWGQKTRHLINFIYNENSIKFTLGWKWIKLCFDAISCCVRWCWIVKGFGEKVFLSKSFLCLSGKKIKFWLRLGLTIRSSSWSNGHSRCNQNNSEKLCHFRWSYAQITSELDSTKLQARNDHSTAVAHPENPKRGHQICDFAKPWGGGVLLHLIFSIRGAPLCMSHCSTVQLENIRLNEPVPIWDSGVCGFTDNGCDT